VNDPDRPYDPDPLGVGTRVRIRLSGECVFGHPADFDGLEGEIMAIFPDSPSKHAYNVALDGPGWTGGGSFARVELERLP
jgi:hypothetical protein